MTGLHQALEFEAGRTAHLFLAAESHGSAAAIDGIERVLERRDQRALARGERYEEVALCRRAADSNRAGHTQRDARESDKALDASGERGGIVLGAAAGQLVDHVT